MVNGKLGLWLFGIFAFLIMSVIVALYLGATEERQQLKPTAGEVTLDELGDYLKKLNVVIGERRHDTKSGQQALRQTAAMIEGTLGPLNIGFKVRSSQLDRAEGLLWKTLWVDLGPEQEEVTLVAIPYGESGTCVGFGLALAEYLVGERMTKKIRIAFYPPVMEMSLWQRVKGEKEVLGEQIDILGGAPENIWGQISAGRYAEIVAATPVWRDQVETVAGRERMTFFLSEKNLLKRRMQAERLLRMVGVVSKSLRMSSE